MSEQLNKLAALAAEGKVRPRVHSGKVETGDAFVLLPPSAPGGKSGLDFVQDVLGVGAAWLVADEADAARLPKSSAQVVVVPDTRAALGTLVRAYYHTRDFKGKMLGLTGTNGKTTCAYLIEALLTAQDERVGVFGTVNYRWPGVVRPSALTTPGCLELHEIFSEMRRDKVDSIIMEVSSHALDQQRVAGLDFDGAILTNLTQDHLDYHGDMENYFRAKARLFLAPEQGGVPVADKVRAVNSEDPFGFRLLEECAGLPGRNIAFGFKKADIKGSTQLLGKILSITPKGIHLLQEFEGRGWELFSPLVGAFNAMNLLAVQALGLGLGMEPEALKALERFTGVPGRLERIANSRGLDAFVDYAHTPDALEKAISALREAGFRRIITIFGCGGNRDRTKRPLMGKAACAYSDLVVLTSDNPRKEAPKTIMADVIPGMSGNYISIVDRREATAEAVKRMRPGDALLIAGKGHEDYQIIGEEKIYYSDQAVLRELLGAKANQL